MKQTQSALWACAVVCVAACAPKGDADADDLTLGDPDVLVGAFQLQLIAAADGDGGATSFVGKVNDGATPEAVLFDEAAVDGDCTLFTPRVPFCAAGCGGDVCVADDECAPYPTSQTVGTVTLRGLGDAIAMDPVANTYQFPADADVGYPPFAEGDAITLDAAGSDFTPAFDSEAAAIAPLVLDESALAVGDGQQLTLSWTPAQDESASVVRVKLDISHHGGTRGVIRCTTADDGALAIAPALTDALVALGVAGFPTVLVTREATGDALTTAGRVDFVLSSRVERDVDVPGVVSCNDDTDCDGEQTCQTDLTCG